MRFMKRRYTNVHPYLFTFYVWMNLIKMWKLPWVDNFCFGASILRKISDTIACFTASCVPQLIQQNVDGSNFFNRSWAEFKLGFNDTTGNYWLGNELLHQLTQNGRYKLRFDLQVRRPNLTWYYAEYRHIVQSLYQARHPTIRYRYLGTRVTQEMD